MEKLAHILGFIKENICYAVYWYEGSPSDEDAMFSFILDMKSRVYWINMYEMLKVWN